MKLKLILTCLMVAIPLSLFACSAAPEPLPVDAVDASYAGKEVEIAVGGSLTVTLESNPTTGFQWSESAQISDQSVIEQLDHEFMAPEDLDDRPPPPGTGGKEVWTFKALKKGTSEISMEYRRPWEQGVQPASTFTLTVLVK